MHEMGVNRFSKGSTTLTLSVCVISGLADSNEGRKYFILMIHSTQRLYGVKPIVRDQPLRQRKEGNGVFNDALNTFYLRLNGVGHMVKGQSDSERGNLLPPHGLLFMINSKGSFICIIPQTG